MRIVHIEVNQFTGNFEIFLQTVLPMAEGEVNRSEVEMYLSEMTTPTATDALSYWKEKEKQYPRYVNFLATSE